MAKKKITNKSKSSKKAVPKKSSIAPKKIEKFQKGGTVSGRGQEKETRPNIIVKKGKK